MNRRIIAAAVAILIVAFVAITVRSYGSVGSPNGGLTLNLPGMSAPIGGLEVWGAPGFFSCDGGGC
jgi:hypothetical protein